MSRIRQILTLHTSLGAPVNYSLQATIPTHMLTQCASALPRPHWEPVLYYSMVLAMGFLLICVIVAAYFEADRLFTADVMKRRSELNQMTFDKSKVFDLKAIANFKLPNDPSAKISSNLYMSRRLPVSTSGTINGHMETGKTPPQGGAHPHRRESWFSRVLCKLPFWLSSGSTVTVVNVKQQASPDINKDQGSADAAKGIGALNSVSGSSSTSSSSSNDRTSGKAGLMRRLVRYLADSCTGRAVFRRIYKAIIPKRLTPKTTKSAASPTSSDRTKDLSVSAVADLDTNSEPNQQAPATVAASSQKKSAEQQQDHSKRLLEVKPLASNKEKISAGPPSTNSTAATTTTATQGLIDESPASKKEAPKNQKPRKAKASELKRANKKHLENEKADKDDSSSTTTETSSIEADEKSTISPRSQENVELSKSKKTRSKVRRKESTKSALPEDPVAPVLAPSVADDFLATSKAGGKANRKTKASQHRSSSPTTGKPSSVDASSSYVTKRDETASKENKPKQVCLPLLTTMEMPSPPAPSANRKKAGKSKSPGCGQVCEPSGCQRRRGPSPSSASLSLWDMPRQGCDEHDALSELSAQTDVFAKTHSIPVVMSKAQLHDPLSSPPIHSSSYSSIVSNNGKVVGDHQLPLTVVSMAPRPGPETGLLATGGGNSEHLVINCCQSSGLMTMSGTMQRQATSRPVAAVGATVRRPWTGGFSHSQSLPEELTAGSCQSGLAEMDLSMATGNRLYYEDPAILAGFSGLGTPTQSYMPPDGYDPYGYVQPMMSNPLDHQVTLMQRLQAERRKRVFEYEMQKQREAGAEWPGFDLPMSIPTPEPTFWEPMISPTNPWGPLPSSTLGVRPSGQAGMWNLGAPPSTDSMGWIGGGNIWSSPELEAKLTPSSAADVGDEMHSGSSATGGAAGAHPIFDPFNTLEIRTGSIWNPTSTESSMTGWGFGGANKPGDNSNMK